jgi:hypothetical protein
MKAFHDGITHDRLNTTRDFLQSLVTLPLTEAERLSSWRGGAD